MYLYATVQVSGTWTVLYKYMTAHMNRSIQIHDLLLEPYYTNTLPLTWTVVYKYITTHLNRSIKIHDLSVEP
jgi:hypothetical protein